MLGLLVFALVVFHCFFTGLNRLGLVGPDEPRYASIARDMALTGDWVTPRLNGAPWLEKPPLYYWSAAIAFRTFSNPEIAARAPAGIFALCAVFALALMAKRPYGPATAVTAAAMLPATVGMTGFARAAGTDMPFAACLTLAMCAAAYLLLEDSPAHARLGSAAFGLSLALAVLAKGPAAILLAGGSTALWALASGEIRRSLRLLGPTATLSFVAVALPWYWLCDERNPGFFRTFFLEQNVERFLTNRYQHQQPFWFFVPVLLIALFPWTFLLVPAIAAGWRSLRKTGWRKSPALFLASWSLFPLVFFSASQSKLPGYILPAVPPLVLLLARALPGIEDSASAHSNLRPLWVAIPMLALGTALILLPRAAPQFLPPLLRTTTSLETPLLLLGLSLLLGGLAVAVAGRLRESTIVAALAAFLFSFAVGDLANHILPLLDSQISPRSLALTIRSLPAGSRVAVYSLPRAWQYGAEFYLERPLPEWTPAMPRPVWVITTPRGAPDLPGASRQAAPLASRGPATIFRVD